MFFLSFVAASSLPSAYAQTTPRNYVAIENAKPGATDWKLTNPGYASGIIEGYASATSVNRGESIDLFVNTRESSYTMDVYRMGYYGGARARKMLSVTRPGRAQPLCPMDSYGTVECNWVDPYILSIPNSPDPTDWMSGMYVVKLTTGTTHTQQYVLFTVRDDTRYSDILMIQAVNTYQAYNVWGGKSLYGTIAAPGDTVNKAVKVSFNRPYYADDGNGSAAFFGGNYQGQELGMLSWLEQNGYDVSYATDVDLDANFNLPLSHKLLEIVGHSEYWSWGMRDTVDRAVAAGVSFASFAGNVSFWQIRYEASAVTGAPSRTIVGYKEFVASDPMATSRYATTLFRDAPVSRPEDLMTGTMFVTKGRPRLCIEDASSWVLAGTSVTNGECIANPDGTPFLGNEIDALGPDAPANIERVGHSPATTANANFSDMTVYRASSGATVFSSGSIGWSETAPQAVQILRNVLGRMIDGTFADTSPIRPLPPAGFQSRDIGPIGRAGFVSLAGPDSFTINGDGQTTFMGKDALFYVYEPLSGDGQMTVRLNHLQEFWDNEAGIMIRESLDPSARYVSLGGRPSEGMTQGADMRVKSTTGGTPVRLASVNLVLPNWLKLVRLGNTFQTFVSADGIEWSPLGSVSVPMTNAVYIGAFIKAAQHNVWMTADFDHVSVSGDTETTAGSSLDTVSASAPTCTTPDPFVSIGGGTCVNGGWIPTAATTAGSAPAPAPVDVPAPSSSATGSCTMLDPFVSIGGGTCVNGGWIPGHVTASSPGLSAPASPAPSVSLSSVAASASTCSIPDPFVTIGGGTCVNGGWVPGHIATGPSVSSTGAASTTTSPASAPSGCTIPDPFVSIGGGTCINGGWVPKR